VVDKCGVGEEGQWEVEDVHRLYGPEQGLTQGFLPTPKYRFLGGKRLRLSTVKLLGHVIGIQPNLHAPQRRE